MIREVCEPIFAKPLNEISFGQFLVQLFRTARQFDMEVQPQLVLLQKTLLDLWETALPFMERWMSEHVGPAAALRELAEHTPELIEQLPRLPSVLLSATRTLKSLERSVVRQGRELENLEKKVANLTRTRRLQRASGAALVVLASVLLFNPARALETGGDLSTTAGLISALVGTLLLLRS